jgi:hypothetical protein
MAAVIDFKVDMSLTDRALKAKLALLPKEVSDKAVKSALRRTGQEGKTEARRAIQETYNLKAATINRYLQVGPVREIAPGRFSVWVGAETSRPGYRGLRLIHFGATQRKNGAVSVKVLKAGKRGVVKGAFQVQQPNGVDDIVKRTNAAGSSSPKVVPKQGAYKGRIIKRGVRKGQYIKRQTLRTLFSVDVAQMFNTKRVNAVIRQRMMERYIHNLRRDIAYHSARFNASP